MDYAAKPGVDALDLAFDTDWSKPPARANWEQNGMGVALSASPVSYEAVLGAPLHAIRNGKTTVIEHLELLATAADAAHEGTVHSVHVVDEGPFRTELELEGTLGPEAQHAAAFTLTATTWTTFPYLRLNYQVVNDTAEDLPLASLVLTLTLPEKPHAFRSAGSTEASDTLAFVQKTADSRSVNGVDTDPTETPWIAWEQGAIAIRRFREQFPKRIDANARRIRIDLVAAEGAPVVYTPGEAQTHEIWIALNDDDPAAFAAAVEHPPVLTNPAYFCATGVLGPAYPHAGAAKFPERMAEIYGGKSWEELGQHLGLRHFPDAPYYGGLPSWSNNYYERMLGLWSEWFMSGDRAWFDRALDVCRHLLDVSVTHSDVPGHDWRGGLRGPGENHVSAPWNPTQRTAGLELYHKLTGDPAARDAYLGVAEFVRRTGAGLGGSSVRQHAGPFEAIVTAYWDTRDALWRDVARKHLADARAAMDLRRGVWPDTHGSQVYRGNVPWMDAQIARPMYWWYRMSGDLDAATALVAMADSIVCENSDWETPGAVYGYSHNPHFDMTAVYDPLILPVIFAAHELTGDAFFLNAAIAQWERWKASDTFDSVFNTYWNVPWLMHYLRVHGLMESPAGAEG